MRSRRSRELFVIFRSVCSGNSGIFYTFALCSLFLRLLSSRRTTTRRDKSWAVAVSLFLFSLSFLLLSCRKKEIATSRDSLLFLPCVLVFLVFAPPTIGSRRMRATMRSTRYIQPPRCRMCSRMRRIRRLITSVAICYLRGE